MNQNFQLTFECKQDWGKMTPAKQGRHCGLCQKTVIDFTGLSQKEISSYAGQKNICARFYDWQRDPLLIKPIAVSKHIKLAALFSALTISLNGTNSFARLHDLPKTENHINTTGNAVVMQSPELKIERSCDSISLKRNGPFLITKRRKYYWSRRFPFIAVVKISRTRIRQGNVRFLED